MKKVTSATTWQDSAGQRLSVTYIEIDDTTHQIIADNARADFIMTAQDAQEAQEIITIGQTYLEGPTT